VSTSAKTAALTISGKPEPLWVLVDANDGTLWWLNVSSEYDVGARNSHKEVTLFTSLKKAKLAAAWERVNCGVELVPKRVAVYAAGAKR
jgi:hypothetical protein